jgi:hypothetical protein
MRLKIKIQDKVIEIPKIGPSLKLHKNIVQTISKNDNQLCKK